MKQHVVNTQYLIGNIAYPVGSVFISYQDTDPATIFGGTWEKISGRFLLSSDDNTHSTVGVNGGSETKTISVNNLPTHQGTVQTNEPTLTGSFTLRRANDNTRLVVGRSGIVGHTATTTKNATVDYRSAEQNLDQVTINATHSHTGISYFTGQNQALNIMPPYVVVNMWKRLTLATVETVTSV